VVTVALMATLPRLTPGFFHRYGMKPSEIEAKYLLLFLFGMGSLAGWAEGEPVLPAYVIGMVLAGTVGKNHVLIRRLRTLTFGLLTPFYFIRAGSYVSMGALIAAPMTFCILLLGKVVTKIIAVHPATRYFGSPATEGMYTTLLMSTGLTFGSISALFGLTHNIIDGAQYSLLVAAVIASAVVPTIIANAYYLPRHLMEPAGDRIQASPSSTSKDKGEDQGEES
jgi:glutathione-regulated potassium-efflux system ancillary protein KefC